MGQKQTEFQQMKQNKRSKSETHESQDKLGTRGKAVEEPNGVMWGARLRGCAAYQLDHLGNYPAS